MVLLDAVEEVGEPLLPAPGERGQEPEAATVPGDLGVELLLAVPPDADRLGRHADHLLEASSDLFPVRAEVDHEYPTGRTTRTSSATTPRQSGIR